MTDAVLRRHLIKPKMVPAWTRERGWELPDGRGEFRIVQGIMQSKEDAIYWDVLQAVFMIVPSFIYHLFHMLDIKVGRSCPLQCLKQLDKSRTEQCSALACALPHSDTCLSPTIHDP